MKGQQQSAPSHRDDGFTLIELLVVIGILAMTAVFVVPWTRATMSGAALQTTVHGLASDLRLARAAARRANVEQALIVDVGARRYWAEAVVPRRSLSNLAVQFTVPESERVGSSTGRLRFLPDGSSSGGNVTLSDGRRTAAVTVDWLNGDVRINWSR